jgi:hypothetical protein
MIDFATFNTVSQFAHWLAGCLFVMGFTYLFGSGAEWWCVGIFTAYAAIKEFWYDQNYETPEVRGSSLQDFLFYEAGVLLAIGLIYLKGKL